MKRAAILMLVSLTILFVLVGLSSCQSNRPVLRAIAELKTTVVRWDSTLHDFQNHYSRHAKAEIDSSVNRLDADELEREIKRFTDPNRKY